MTTIAVKNLSKRFGAIRAVDDVSIELAPGKIYGLLGRNGAGKTTLLNLITQKIFQDSGQVMIDGCDVAVHDALLSHIYHMTDKNYFPDAFRVKKLFRFCQAFYPEFHLPYAEALAEKFSLTPSKTLSQLSTGYATILRAILALSSNAPVVFFDEPVLGLDAAHRELFYRELIAHSCQSPKTIVISTHLIDEVAEILEEVIILQTGRIALQQPVEELLEQACLVTGANDKVSNFVAGRTVVGGETLGNAKAAIVMSPITLDERHAGEQAGLEFSRVNLQRLFIALTNQPGVQR